MQAKEGYRRAEDFFKNSRHTNIAEDVRQEVTAERKRTILEPYRIRQAEIWSELSSMIVSG